MKIHLDKPFATRAQPWIRYGLRVFPCWPNTKKPCIQAWQDNASCDPEVIAEWSRRWPQANIAVTTANSCIFFIDIDKKKGEENPWVKANPDLFEELMLAAAVVNMTPCKGYHLGFFYNPEWEFDVRAGVLPGIDIRVANGYVIAPESYYVPDEKELKKGKIEGAYTCINPCEAPPEKWPLPPQKMLDILLDAYTNIRVNKPIATQVMDLQRTGKVPAGEGLRHDALVRECGRKAYAFSNAEGAYTYMVRWSEANMEETLSKAEIMKTVYSMEWRGVKNTAPGDMAEQFNFTILTNRELAEGEFTIEYLVDDVLVKGQPCILAAPKKSMKTTISIDLALSLASGDDFLNYFPVNGKYRVLIMSAESGMATLQETEKRIRKSKNIPIDVEVFWSSQVPSLDNPAHAGGLERAVKDLRIDVIIFDPAYLMMCGIGDSAGNMFKVAQFLLVITKLIELTGVTPIVLHHTNRSGGNTYDPLELDSIAWAGFPEWMRQWILINRRERYDPDNPGVHRLWLVTGGSAGHTRQVGVDIEEGSIKDNFGRRWDVSVEKSSDIYDDIKDRKASQAAENKRIKADAALKEGCDAIYNKLLEHGASTKAELRVLTGMGAPRIDVLMAYMLGSHRIEQVDVYKEKNNRTYPGFRVRTEF